MKKKSQSVLEYVVILTAIIAAIIFWISSNGPGDSSKGLGKILHKSASAVGDSSARIANIVQ